MTSHAERPRTLRELRQSGYKSRSVKDEMRTNLIRRLRDKQPLFPGIVGYDETVLPQIVNAVLYLARGGCSWRMLPHDFPPWKTVSYYFYTWRDAGVWERVHDALRAEVRAAAGKEPTPSLAIIDSQSVKTTEKGGSGATTPANRSRGASGISWSIPSG